MTPFRPALAPSRLLLPLAVAAAVACAGCAVPVAQGLGEEDADRVLVALERVGVDTSKEADPAAEGKFRVLVSREEAARAVATLREEELPPRASPGMLDALGKSALVPSGAVEHAQYLIGLSGELERTLSGVDGVVSARVHVSVPPPNPFGDRAPPRATAAVLLKHRGSSAPLDVASVQRLVAGAVAGMSPDDVSVVLLPRPTPAPAAERQIAHMGPIAVTRGSLVYLRLFLALPMLLSVLLSVALVAVWARARRLLVAPAAEEPR